MTLNCFLASHNVRLIENMALIPGRVQKHGMALLSEGYFQTPSVAWEQRIDNGYPNVFYDDTYGEYRCYYTCFIRDDASVRLRPEQRVHETYNFYRRDLFRGRIAGILLATSKDGEHWVRPALNATEFDGYRDSNILLANVHGASVFKDVNETDPSRRYKMVMRHDLHEKMAVSFSPDGIHWCEPIDWPDYNPAGDTHNFAFWDERAGKYVLITRTWDAGSLRLCARCESDDFIHWSVPTEVYRGDGLADQIYSMPVFTHGGLYFGLGSFFHDGNRRSEDFDCVDCELLYSYDSHHWNRVSAGKPFIPRSIGRYGDNVPDCACIYASVPIEKDGQYEIFYMGGNGQHTNFRETTLLRATVDPDALAGYAPLRGRGGLLSTCLVAVRGDRLLIKAEIAGNGSLTACISAPFGLHEGISPIEGFTFSDCTFEKAGHNLWQARFSRPLSALDPDKGHIVVMKADNAVLYGFGGDVQPFRVKK